MLKNHRISSETDVEQIIGRLEQCLPAILRDRPVLLAYLYGSVALGYPTPLSDVDIALVLDPDCGLDAYQRLMLELEITTDVEQQCAIPNADVRSIDDAPVRIQGEAVTQGKLLYARREAFRVAYEVRTRKHYFDFQPVLEMMCESYFARLEDDLKKRRHGMVDPQTFERIFRNLDVYVDQLRHLAMVPRQELTGDLVKLGAAKYYLQVAIECCLDTANHIIARQGFRAPESYADSFTVLAENGVIEQDFASTARRMVGLRNRLVHLYWEVDANVLYSILQNNLDDFDQFKAYVYSFLRELE